MDLEMAVGSGKVGGGGGGGIYEPITSREEILQCEHPANELLSS